MLQLLHKLYNIFFRNSNNFVGGVYEKNVKSSRDYIISYNSINNNVVYSSIK